MHKVGASREVQGGCTSSLRLGPPRRGPRGAAAPHEHESRSGGGGKRPAAAAAFTQNDGVRRGRTGPATRSWTSSAWQQAAEPSARLQRPARLLLRAFNPHRAAPRYFIAPQPGRLAAADGQGNPLSAGGRYEPEGLERRHRGHGVCLCRNGRQQRRLADGALVACALVACPPAVVSTAASE